MLEMGFQKDVETIIMNVKAPGEEAVSTHIYICVDVYTKLKYIYTYIYHVCVDIYRNKAALL
jgi:hypothetical protein